MLMEIEKPALLTEEGRTITEIDLTTLPSLGSSVDESHATEETVIYSLSTIPGEVLNDLMAIYDEEDNSHAIQTDLRTLLGISELAHNDQAEHHTRMGAFLVLCLFAAAPGEEADFNMPVEEAREKIIVSALRMSAQTLLTMPKFTQSENEAKPIKLNLGMPYEPTADAGDITLVLSEAAEMAETHGIGETIILLPEASKKVATQAEEISKTTEQKLVPRLNELGIELDANSRLFGTEVTANDTPFLVVPVYGHNRVLASVHEKATERFTQEEIDRDIESVLNQLNSGSLPKKIDANKKNATAHVHNIYYSSNNASNDRIRRTFIHRPGVIDEKGRHVIFHIATAQGKKDEGRIMTFFGGGRLS